MAAQLLSGSPAGLFAPSPIVPSLKVVDPTGQVSAQLIIDNGNGSRVSLYMDASAGGGLQSNNFQQYLYSPDVGGNGIAQISRAYALNGNNNAAVAQNFGTPLDAARVGIVTGTGAAVLTNVPSLSAQSQIFMAFLDGTPAANGTVVPAVVPAVAPALPTQFTVTLPAACRYSYIVFG
jgi:hypothetical protein